MKFLIVLVSICIVTPTFAAELSGRDSKISIFVQSGFGDGVRTSSGDLTLASPWAAFLPETGIASGASGLQVKLYNQGVSIGTSTVEGLDSLETARFVKNAQTLNGYLSKGAKITLSANPTAKEVSAVVAGLENSNKPEILKMKISLLEEKVEDLIGEIKDTRRDCRKDKRELRRAVRDANRNAGENK